MTNHTQFADQLTPWAPLPPDAASALATWRTACGYVTESPMQTLRDAAAAGTVNEHNVLDALTEAGSAINAGKEARTLIAELNYPLTQRFANAITAHADDIVIALRPAFERAAVALTRAAGVIPADIDADRVLEMGPDAMTAWQTLAQAGGALDAIANIRNTLANNFGYDHGGARVAAYLDSVTDADELTHYEFVFRGVEHAQRLDNVRGGTWAHLTRRGAQLALNTRAEAQQVAAAPAATAPVAVA